MTQTREPAAPARPFTGWHMLAVVVGFFGVVIAVNITLAVFAATSWTGLIVPNSYVASQEYNRVLEEANLQDALGWRDTLAYDDGRLAFTLADADGRPLAGRRVVATVRRPVHEGEDRQVDLDEATIGAYATALSLDPGLWEIEVSAAAGDPEAVPYKMIYRIEVPGEPSQ